MKILPTIICVLCFLIFHSGAQAQTQSLSLDYSQKNRNIMLAKAGDSEALFQLGRAHFTGENAAQNGKVAQRFFYYAAQKGHLKAKTYLSRLEDALSVKSQITATEPSGRLPLSENSSVIKKEIKRNRPIVTKVPDTDLQITLGEQALHNIVSSDTLAPSVNIETISAELQEPKVMKLTQPVTAVTDNNISFNSSPIAGADLKILDGENLANNGHWKFYVLTLCFLSLFFIGSFIWFLRRQNDELPNDFNGVVYLKLHPDVKAAGMNPQKHYLNHGLSEGRRYKYGYKYG